MIEATCIEKFRSDNNTIYGYTIQDSKGNCKYVTADKLKSAMRANLITVNNLTLTSDDRLISANKSKKGKSFTEKSLKNLMIKAIALGFRTERIPTACGHYCVLVSKSNTDHIIYILDDVEYLNDDFNGELVFSDHISPLQGNIKVEGGQGLEDIHKMFYMSQAQSIDLSSFNTSNVINMEYMFYECKAVSIDFTSFNTSNVTAMRGMFGQCIAKGLNLSSFNTSNVRDMSSMFYECKAQAINLSSFNTSNVTNMNQMFCGCDTQSIDLSSFNTSKVCNMMGMFDRCRALFINVDSFDTSNVTDMSRMFRCCRAKTLNLSSFDTRSVVDVSYMFAGHEGLAINLTSFKLGKETCMRDMLVGCKAMVDAKDKKILVLLK